jgi:ketopantoate reductase
MMARREKEATLRIMIMGSGGMGAYYGGLLAQQGNDVTFVARGAHLQALRAMGLQVKSIHGDFAITPVGATDDPATLVPEYVSLPRGVRAASGEIEWSRDPR